MTKKVAGDSEFYVLPDVGEVAVTDSQLVFTDKVKLDIKKSATGNYELIRTYKANGRKAVFAETRANNIQHELVQAGSVLSFGESVTVPKDDHYREQEVELLLRVPEGKAV